MSPKVVRIVAWIATTVLAIIILSAGVPKLAGAESLKEPFIEFGWPDPVFWLTGLAETVAAVGLLIRQFRVAATAVIGFVMLGAAVTNIVNGAFELVPFNVILLLTCGALALHYAAIEGLSVKDALLTTGRWKPSPSPE